MDPNDTARFLADSPDRCRLLSALREPGAPSDLAERLGLSRRGVQRNLAAFAERGWAEKREGRYRLTTTGALVTDRHAEYLETLERLDRFEPFYRRFPRAEDAPDPAWLDDADLTVATPENPQAPVHEYVTAVRGLETDRLRMLSPVLSRLFHDAHADLALRGVHTELVMSAATVERARELNPTEFAVVVSVDVLDLYRYPDPIDLGLTVGDDRVLVGTYDDDGQLQALVESRNPACVEWAGALFERYREGAERMEPTISLPFRLRKS